MSILRFDRTADYPNVGRNGVSQACGLSVETLGDDVALRPINSQGHLTVCRIQIPREHAGQVGAMLLAIDGETWTYDAVTLRISDENGLKVAEGVVAEDAAVICSANRLINAGYQARIARAAQRMLEAFGGDAPGWIREEAQALEEALHEGGYDRTSYRGNPAA